MYLILSLLFFSLSKILVQVAVIAVNQVLPVVQLVPKIYVMLQVLLALWQ